MFRIDAYFTEYILAIEIDEQNHEGREPIFEKKRQEALEKNLVPSLLELIQVMQKEVIIKIMKLVKYKDLLVNLKTDKRITKRTKQKNKRKRKQNKRTRR